MKKRITQLLILTIAATLLSGCGLLERFGKKGNKEPGKKPEEQKEVSYAIDNVRYQKYAEVLDDVIDDNEWPDGASVSEEYQPYLQGNQYAICDIDMDGEDELIVEITDEVPVAGMITCVFDYDKEKDEVVEEYCGFPGMIFFDNGILYEPMSHNQTGGDAIYPYDLYKYDKKGDQYNWLAQAYCIEEGDPYGEYKAEDDADNDGVIYYVSEGGKDSSAEAYTKEEYEAWYEEKIGKAKKIYIPWESMWERDIANIEYIATIEGSVKPNRIAVGQKITQYDINGNEKKDRIEVRIEARDPYSDLRDAAEWGTKWSILINDKVELSLGDGSENRYLDVYFYQVSPRRTYLYVKQTAEYNGYVLDADLYQFQDGERVEQLDCYQTIVDHIKGAYPDGVVACMTKDKLQIEGSAQLNATANVEWHMNYAYQENEQKWALAEEEFPIVGRWWENDLEQGWTANQAIKAYKNYDSNEIAFTIKRGEVVYLDALRFHQGKTYFKVRTKSGAIGWFEDPKESYTEMNGTWLSGYFEEAMFAG